MKFLRYLNLGQKNTIKALGIFYFGYFILIFLYGFQNTIMLYLRFILSLAYIILIPGYFFSVIALERDRLGKLSKLGIFYLSLIWGSIIVIFEVLVMSLVATLSFFNLIVLNGIFSSVMILIISSNGMHTILEVPTSSEAEDARKITSRPNYYLKTVLIISVMIVLIAKARFLLYALLKLA